LDENDPAWKIAVAARASLGNDPDALDRTIAALQPSVAVLLQAHDLCLTTSPFSNSEAIRIVINSRLQIELAKSQERVGETTNSLTRWILLLTVVLLVLAVIEFWQRHGHG
jgi:hypothetical protein